MSTFVSGIFCLNKNDLITQEKFTFRVQKIASDFEIGCKFGGNISEAAFKNYSAEHVSLNTAFELMDTPIDNSSEELFGPEIYEEENEGNLEKRMLRIENFFHSILESSEVDRIILDICYTEGFKEQTLELQCFEFTKRITTLYAENIGYAPIIRLVIKK